MGSKEGVNIIKLGNISIHPVWVNYTFYQFCPLNQLLNALFLPLFNLAIGVSIAFSLAIETCVGPSAASNLNHYATSSGFCCLPEVVIQGLAPRVYTTYAYEIRRRCLGALFEGGIEEFGTKAAASTGGSIPRWQEAASRGDI